MKGETMGQRIQRLRQAAGLSQSGLSKAAGIPVGTIKNWEQGIRFPRLDLAAKVARALDITLDELAGVAGEPKSKKGKRQ
jgi:transcriptional regulator with XRE-family HTH domain